jgi:phosphatidylglycerophosphate synthase
MYAAVISIGSIVSMWFYSFRNFWERLSVPLLRAIPSWVKPDHLSWSRVPLGAMVAFFLFVYSAPVVAGLLYILAWITDILDGALARYRKQFSKWGSRIDPLVDKVMNVTIFIAYIYCSNEPEIVSASATLWIIIGIDGLTTLVAGLVFYFREIRIDANIFGKWKFGTQCAGGTLLIFKCTSLALPILPVAAALGIMSFLSYSYEGYYRLRN